MQRSFPITIHKTKCLNAWQVSLFIAFFMDIVDIIRLLLILKIKKRLHLHVHLVHMHIGECPLVSIVHLQLFKDA